jgi:hypothetical protein
MNVFCWKPSKNSGVTYLKPSTAEWIVTNQHVCFGCRRNVLRCRTYPSPVAVFFGLNACSGLGCLDSGWLDQKSGYLRLLSGINAWTRCIKTQTVLRFSAEHCAVSHFGAYLGFFHIPTDGVVQRVLRWDEDKALLDIAYLFDFLFVTIDQRMYGGFFWCWLTKDTFERNLSEKILWLRLCWQRLPD